MRNRNIYHPIDIRSDFVRKNAFELIIAGQDELRILCKSITVVLPKTNSVQVPWIGGVMQLAGRVNSQYSFTASFLVGTDRQYDSWRALYDWRTKVFNHDTGRIALAHEYKKEATINIYDVTADADDTGNSLQYMVKADGVWPTDVQDLTFSVEDDAVLEVSATFAADKIWIEKFGK
jgi:hypothetical protein